MYFMLSQLYFMISAKRNNFMRQKVINRLLVVIAFVVLGIILLAETWCRVGVTMKSLPLTKPLRTEVVSEIGGRGFMLALGIHHYRAQLQSEAEHFDVFYDTKDRELQRQGYSFRFRKETTADTIPNYLIRLEQEPRHLALGAEKLDIISKLPARLGEEIVNGKWDDAFLATVNLAAPSRFVALLVELRIDVDEIHPQLVGQLRRKRFDITDKGRNWFELDQEMWSFSLFDGANGPRVTFKDFVVDTRLSGTDAELQRRVSTMRELTKMIYGIRPVEYAPHERAFMRINTMVSE
jgi:hypothetical protein